MLIASSTRNQARTKWGLGLVIAATLAMLLSTFVSGTASAAYDQFSDVPSSHKFRTEIHWLAGQKITTGYADDTFRPRDSVSREAFAAFLYRLEGRPSVTLPPNSPFKDVSKSAQFYKEIVWLSQKGISTGWADGTFRPKDKISREAVSAFLYRFDGKPAFSSPPKSPFKDMKRSSPFYKEVTWLAQTGMTTGYADGTFKPKANVSREAIAAFLYRGHGTFQVGERVDYGGIGLTVKSADIVSQIKTLDGPSLTPRAGENLVLLRTEVTELKRSGNYMSCPDLANPGIRMWDDKGNEIQEVFTYGDEIIGNFDCYPYPLTGETYEWKSAWRVREGRTPYAITIRETENWTGYVVIYFEPKGLTIVP